MVFTSKTTDHRIVGFSVPVWSAPTAEPRRVLGVLTMTVELGRFAELRSDPSSNNQVAVLVDTRPDDQQRQGSILEHPHLAKQLRNRQKPDAAYLAKTDVRLMEQLRRHAAHRANGASDEVAGPTTALLEDYRDPIGGDYGGRWLAACEPVFVDGRSAKAQDTGWVVIVQERLQ